MIFSSNGDLIVYVTKTGTKYHLEGCSSLRSSKIPTTLQEAVSRGMGPCSICSPPTLVDEATLKAVNVQTVLYRVNKENLVNHSEADLSKLVAATVRRVVDGDTIQVEIINPPDGLQGAETVRLLGEDTPESVHPSKPMEHFGKEASEFTKSRLEGKTVYLVDGTCHNASIIQEGYGFAYLTYVFQFKEEFSTLQREAREKGMGLWKE